MVKHARYYSIAEEVLRDDRSKIPGWLQRTTSFSAKTLKQFLSSRVVYYPGSGEDDQEDDHAVELFGSTHAAHCFVHADYWESFGGPAANVQFLLGPATRRFGGHQLCFQQEVLKDELLDLIKRLIKAKSKHPCPGQDSKLTRALWAVLERRPDSASSYLRQRFDALHALLSSPSGILGPNDSPTEHEPPLIAFLHISAEAVWVYDKLWARRGKAPYAILLQNHGNGLNWGGDQAPLYRLARDCNALPRWLLVGENTLAWPGYEEASYLTEPRGGGGGPGHPRRLFRLAGSEMS